MARTPKPPKIGNHPNFIQRLIMIFGGGFLFIFGPVVWVFGFLTLGVRATIDRLTLDYLVSFVFFSLLVTILYYAASPAVWVKTFETIAQSNKLKLAFRIAMSCFLSGLAVMIGILLPWDMIAENVGGLPDPDMNGPLAFVLFCCGVLVMLAYMLLKGLPNEPPEVTNGPLNDFMDYHYDGFLHFIGLGRFAPKWKVIDQPPASKKAAHAGNDSAFDFDPAAFGADARPDAKSESTKTAAGSAQVSDTGPKLNSEQLGIVMLAVMFERMCLKRGLISKDVIEKEAGGPEADMMAFFKEKLNEWGNDPTPPRFSDDDLDRIGEKKILEIIMQEKAAREATPTVPRGVDQRHPDDAKLWAVVDDPSASPPERKTAFEMILQRQEQRAEDSQRRKTDTKDGPKQLPPS